MRPPALGTQLAAAFIINIADSNFGTHRRATDTPASEHRRCFAFSY